MKPNNQIDSIGIFFMKTVCVANQKGGVGKTAIAVHLAFKLADRGYKVLYIDLDPQANGSKTLESFSVGMVASSLFSCSPALPSIDFDASESRQISLISADPVMADIERKEPSIIVDFKQNLERISEQFDYCVIDTPPTMGLRITAALIVSDYVLSPIELEEYSIDGIEKMLKTIFGIKEKWNPDLQFLGMLANRFSVKSFEQKNAFMTLASKYSHLIIKAKIAGRVAVPRALKKKMPVWDHPDGKESGEEFAKAFDLIFEKMGVK